MSHREEASGKTQDTLERLCLSAGLGTPRVPPEELEEVSGVREVWASLLQTDCCLRDPVPDQADEEDEDVRMLFLDYSSAFNTVIPHKLTTKRFHLGFNSTLCDWLQDFLTGSLVSGRITGNTDNTILKFADDTTVIGLISGGDETAYRREVASLVKWCDSNNLSLNTDKTRGDGPGHEEREEEAAPTSDDQRL
ncbi:hypothetical protein L3Q82_000753 [Scortum barcoo]|uniref:Uncharacterized protein n=1 Tax=Scortum barcoo TaxID=214431 RepID=A0ACB8WE58_9TELE|nr:hypothetical protein L3Q82_000753 [Scortum barcoo]